MSRTSAAITLSVALLLACGSPARAEGPTTSMSVWRIHGAEAEVRAWVPVALARRFGATGEGDAPANAESFARAGWLTGDYLGRRLVLSTSAGPCEPVAGGPQRGTVDGAWIVHSWRVRCAEASGWRLRDDAFFEDAPSHAHFARVWCDDAAEPLERVLTSGERVLVIRGGEGTSSVASAGECARRSAPLVAALMCAVAASGWAAGSGVRRALAAAAGFALGALAPVAHAAGVEVAALAILAVAFATFAGERRLRGLGWLLLAGCAALVALRGGASARWIASGVVMVAVTTTAGRRLGGPAEAAAGLIVAAAVIGGGPPLALEPRALVAAGIGLPLLVLAGITRRHDPPRWVASAVAAAVVAVTLAWCGLGSR